VVIGLFKTSKTCVPDGTVICLIAELLEVVDEPVDASATGFVELAVDGIGICGAELAGFSAGVVVWAETLNVAANKNAGRLRMQSTSIGNHCRAIARTQSSIVFCLFPSQKLSLVPQAQDQGHG